MSHNPATDFSVEEEVVEDEFAADDFGFVIGFDGQLKSIVIPEHLMEEPPEEVQMILSFFGIDSIHQLDSRTLH